MPCTMLALLLMKRGGARTNSIRWWTGRSPRLRHCRFVTAGALTLAGCIRFTAVLLAGAVPCNALTSCGNCGPTTRSCGRGCGIWTTGHGLCSAPALWDSSRKIGAWSGWRNALPVRKRQGASDKSPSLPSGNPALILIVSISKLRQEGVDHYGNVCGISRKG